MKKAARLITATAGALLIAASLASCGGSSSGSSASSNSAFPVKAGEVGPIAQDNPLQEPFVCALHFVPNKGGPDMGQPVVDNHDGIGKKVTDQSNNVIGYSKNCGAPMQVVYRYRAQGDGDYDAFHVYDPQNPPNDVATLTVDGQQVPFIVRYEIGTINRFIYTIVSLAPQPNLANPGEPDKSAWNGKLLFHFVGGTGIGHAQGRHWTVKKVVQAGIHPRTIGALKEGYAVLASTGAATEVTYNLQLTGKTAHMVKQQFVAEFGKPKYTFGVGDSGGGVQQLVYAQNYPDLIDGLIPMQPFPDMVTQVNSVGDCELLQYYFDVTDAQVNGTGNVDPLWKKWANRQMISGFHGIDGQVFKSSMNGLRQATGTADKGSDVCRYEWFGAVPEFINPLWSQEGPLQPLVNQIPLSFFDDLADIFGRIPGTNLANSTYDNVGVQYGLVALRRGKITKQEFLDLNAHVGGWVPRNQMVEPGQPFGGTGMDPWGSRNNTVSANPDPNAVAPRSKGSAEAIKSAYQDGLVFMGNIDQPTIIIEPWLEPELNEHASREAFSVRQRMIQAKGNADNLAIWMPDSDDRSVMTALIAKALDYENQWLDAGARPSAVKNACFDSNADVIAEGDDVFEGQVSPDGSNLHGGLDAASTQGACTQQFPIYSNGRIQAGANVSSHIMKCALKPVGEALNDGTYGNVTFTLAQQMKLYQIFPQGVCDYTQPGQGMPVGWM